MEAWAVSSQGTGSFARRYSFIVSMIYVAFISGCNLPSAAETDEPVEPEIALEEMALEEALAVQPEDRRPTVLEEMGAPDAFTLTFEELEGVVVRWEAWSYFDFGSRFDFIDGELLWNVELEPMPDGSIYTHFYDPRDFHAYMSVAAGRALLEEQELVEIDLTDGDIPGGLILAGDQIMLGFDSDRLVYVETFTLTPDDGPEAVALVPTLAEATVTVEQSTATLAVTPVPAPVGPPTNTAVPGQPVPLELGELLFEDTFQSTTNAVPLFDPNVMTFMPDAGQGVMTANFQGGVLGAMYSDLLAQDFIAELEIYTDELAPGSRVGIIFRSDDVPDGLAYYYHLLLGPTDGVLTMDVWKDGQWGLLDSVDISETLMPASGTHRLRLEADGSAFRVFLNGTFILDVVDSQVPDAGIFGLSVVSANPPETVTFDNLRIYTLP